MPVSLKEFKKLRTEIDRPILQTHKLPREKKDAILRAVQASSLARFISNRQGA